jgi:hypothetical protein
LDMSQQDVFDIEVIYLVKDLRRFIYSQHKRGRSPWYALRNRCVINLSIRQYLRKIRKKWYMILSYEELVANYVDVMKECEQHYSLTLSTQDLIANLNTESFHVFSWNPIKQKAIVSITLDDSRKQKTSMIQQIRWWLLAYLPNRLRYK